MGIEPVISLQDQLAIKSLFAASVFIPSDQQNRLWFRIKGKSHSPFTACCIEA